MKTDEQKHPIQAGPDLPTAASNPQTESGWPEWNAESGTGWSTALEIPRPDTEPASKPGVKASLRAWWRSFWFIDEEELPDDWSDSQHEKTKKGGKLLSETMRASETSTQTKKTKQPRQYDI